MSTHRCLVSSTMSGPLPTQNNYWDTTEAQDQKTWNLVGSTMPDPSDVPPEMLERYLTRLFKLADTNGDGVLQPQEFASVSRCETSFIVVLIKSYNAHT